MITGDGPKTWLFESRAIATFLDLHFPEPSLRLPLNATHSFENAKIDEWISLISDSVFDIVIKNFTKKRMYHEYEKHDEDTISSSLSSNLDRVRDLFTLLEERSGEISQQDVVRNSNSP
jgi:glutathione S-transferase